MIQSVFGYLDYRTYLGDFYAQRKADDPAFSYQRFADMLGFSAKDFIYRVIKGQKNLSPSSVKKISTALRMKKAEAQYFSSLVYFCQAAAMEQKQRAYGRLREVLDRSRRVRLPELLDHQQLELFACWYYPVIRSLIEMHSFCGDYAALAAQITPPIREKQARRAVEVLRGLGLVGRRDDGSLYATQKSLTTGEAVLRHALTPFYTDILELGKKSIEGVAREQRNISGLTIGISERTYERIARKIADFRAEVRQIADADDGADRVYELALLLFPLSTGSIKRGPDEKI